MNRKSLERPFLINDKRKIRLQVLSSGGGTQSNCMIVLIAQGMLPKPDLVLMADTGREATNVFDYQREYIKPICDEIRLTHAAPFGLLDVSQST